MVPISLIVDDSCPLVHVYASHRRDVHHQPLVTPDGRPIPLCIPNEFLHRFCDVCDRWGIAGKFSVVVAPGAMGDLDRGIAGFRKELTEDWVRVALERLSKRWDFCCEGITHNLAVDLSTGKCVDESENAWSQHQDRATLAPYLTYQLAMLKRAGIDATGVTSPWVFGLKVEPDYQRAIIDAQLEVYARKFSWYFLHMLWNEPSRKPWVAFQDETSTLVSIPALVNDFWWSTIDSPRSDREWISEVTDKMLSADGRTGQIREVLDAGGWPIVLTHWQSLFSNGIESGLAVLDELGRRVSLHLGGEVEWRNFSEIAERTVREQG